MSELTQAYNPESKTINYSYDGNGNVVAKTDARGITTQYTYDVLNRLVAKTYQGDPSSTPPVTYGYDGVAGTVNCPPALTPANPLGKQTSMCDGAGKDSWSYPLNSGVGWETIDQRTTNGVTKTMTSQNNLDGSLASVTYPDGRTVSYAPGGAGRPLAATDNGSGTTYVSGASYAPFGALASLQMGPSISLNDSYNDRLQPVFLSAQGGAGTIYSLGYDFHLNNGDNGNVYQIVNNKDGNRTQNFTYDALNRIQTAYTNGPNWGETFTIDMWGNLTNSDAVAGKNFYELRNFGPALTNNQLSGFGYDLSGNMTQNGGAHYTYDAESRLTSAGGVNYFYDGDGNRVEKSNGTLYWGSGPLAESDLNGGNWTDYIFFNGKRVARIDPSGILHYYFSDHLGSTSVVTDAAGNIQEESDYYPYGGEMPIITGDSNHYKFTGKERDTESGLDYFIPRHYASTMGRFMQPDPDGISSSRRNPQTWNMYAYVLNNPLRFTDPDGMNYTVCDNNGKNCADLTDKQYDQWRKDNANVQVSASGAISIVNDNGSTTKVGQETYYNEKDIQAAQQLVATQGLILNLGARMYIGGFTGGAFGWAAGEFIGGLAEGLSAEGEVATAGSGANTIVGSRRSPISVAPGTNEGTEIGGRWYTGHALDQMQGRGLMPSVIEDNNQNRHCVTREYGRNDGVCNRPGQGGRQQRWRRCHGNAKMKSGRSEGVK